MYRESGWHPHPKKVLRTISKASLQEPFPQMKRFDVDAYSYEISGPNGGEAFTSNPEKLISRK
jgi:hypothetical protein